MKTWRVNVVVCYDNPACADRHRDDTMAVLIGLANIYSLDYSVSEAHPFSHATDLPPQYDSKGMGDLVYFRSNEDSRLSAKQFRKVISCVFDTPPSAWIAGCSVGTQLARLLSHYSFPTTFHRPLNYPNVELHQDGHISLLSSFEYPQTASGKGLDN